MDANQTRFHLVFGQQDWFGASASGSPPSAGIEWRASDSTVGLRQTVFVFPAPLGSTPLTIANRRGAAQDQFGNYYWVSPTQDEILFLENGQQQGVHFWSTQDIERSPGTSSLGAFQPVSPRLGPHYIFGGLAVTTDHYLLAGTIDPPGLLLFDLYSGAPPLEYRWPAAVPFAPFAIAAGTDGGAWILDRDNRRYWGIDPYFRILTPLGAPPEAQRPPDFVPAAGAAIDRPECEPEEGITAFQAMTISAVAPMGIAALPDGSVLILDNPPGLGFSQIYRYQLQSLVGPPFALNAIDTGQPASYALLGQDIAFFPAATQSAGSVQGTVYVADSAGQQTFSFSFDSGNAASPFEPETQFLPMLRFGGKALVSGPSGVSYDFDQRWTPLVPQPRARFESQATWTLPQRDADRGDSAGNCAFDGQEPGCVWHRLLFDGSIPSGTQVLVASRAADDKAVLAAADWNPEPQPYLRFTGSELPYYKPSLTCCAGRTGTWELLFQAAVGRYLQVQLTFVGNSRSTPRIQSLRAYYPRFSYLRRYLPAVYQDNASSASFLDRYLANPEGFFTVLEGRIQQVQELFDARTVPDEYLEWLAGWLGISFDFTWTNATRRFFLENAPRFFQTRGTPDGMVRMIRLALDQCASQALFDPADAEHFSVRVVEHFLLRNAPGVTFGDPTDVQTPGSVAQGQPWSPSMGSAALNASFGSFLESEYGTIAALNQAWGSGFSGFSDPLLQLPAIQPPQSAQAADWLQFIASIGFTYAAVTAADEPSYASFLASRYASVAALNAAYQLSGAAALGSFAEIQSKLWNATLAVSLPPGGAFLQDWILFVSVVVPTAQNAYRFSVIVPVRLQDDQNTQMQRRNLAQRIAQNEKPAHTDFDVKLYWAAFCVGEARVGIETVAGPSSRFAAVVLDQTQLAGSYLSFVAPWNVSGRLVAGRDQLEQSTRVRSGEPAL
jgi:phage tail-like protein